ncbi:hypothetical protein MSHI_32210 [Mycobacterium shinjukuense]|uniref:DUF222 domain-containing protein n=1 Tax=Mycobacterium shinjukuense TaxID=398694 RepID=A0A7I7MSZ7_9MYCO|nr:hypothetical protein MSHI_32210 [Mycobacterium shinjukuense]
MVSAVSWRARRIGEAAELGPRRALTGQPLAPVLAASAAAHRAGTLGTGQIGVIRRFSHRLPGWVDAPTRDCAEATPAKKAPGFAPNNWPGWPTNSPTAATPTGITVMRTGPAGAASPWAHRAPMACRGCAAGSPRKARASVEAVWAKLAAPAWATPPTKPRAWTAHPASRPSSLIPAARPNASTMA